MIIGITGSFGTGKTTVADMFRKYGFKVINADRLYHNIYNKNSSLKKKIKEEFETLDRDKIKKIVFNDSNKLKKLNKITHPIIINEIKKEISAIIKKSNKKDPIFKKFNEKINLMINKDNKIKNNKKLKNNEKSIIGNKANVNVVLDIPLLFEAKAANLVDKIIVVKCSEKAQIQRILKKGKYTKAEIENIIKSQMPLKEKMKYADFVVDNSGVIEDTEKQVKMLVKVISAKV